MVCVGTGCNLGDAGDICRAAAVAGTAFCRIQITPGWSCVECRSAGTIAAGSLDVTMTVQVITGAVISRVGRRQIIGRSWILAPIGRTRELRHAPFNIAVDVGIACGVIRIAAVTPVACYAEAGAATGGMLGVAACCRRVDICCIMAGAAFGLAFSDPDRSVVP